MLKSESFDFCGSKSDASTLAFREYMERLTEYILENDTCEVPVEEGDLGWGIDKGVNKITLWVFNPAA